jgi:flagellar biosynthesis anti-sigma factor FlgM
MKIENSGIPGLTSKQTDASQKVEKKTVPAESNVSSVNQTRDKAELSNNARILSKARQTLDSADMVESERVSRLRNDVASGDYKIQVDEIAKRLMAGVFSKQ